MIWMTLLHFCSGMAFASVLWSVALTRERRLNGLYVKMIYVAMTAQRNLLELFQWSPKLNSLKVHVNEVLTWCEKEALDRHGKFFLLEMKKDVEIKEVTGAVPMDLSGG